MPDYRHQVTMLPIMECYLIPIVIKSGMPSISLSYENRIYETGTKQVVKSQVNYISMWLTFPM